MVRLPPVNFVLFVGLLISIFAVVYIQEKNKDDVIIEKVDSIKERMVSLESEVYDDNKSNYGENY